MSDLQRFDRFFRQYEDGAYHATCNIHASTPKGQVRFKSGESIGKEDERYAYLDSLKEKRTIPAVTLDDGTVTI